MSVYPLDWDNVRTTCERLASRVAELLRTAPDPAAPVPGLEWTVAELAAHLVSLTRRYEPFVRNATTPNFESMPELNAQELDGFSARSLEELAGLLEDGTTSLLSLCSSGEAPAHFFEMESDCASTIALLVEELLVHGFDIARAVRRPWPITKEESLIALAAVLQVTPMFVNQETTRGRRVQYELRLRGGPTITVTFDDGTATVRHESAARPDCRISADPTAFLLTGLNRQSRLRSAITGKMMAYGRKPWLALRLTDFLAPA